MVANRAAAWCAPTVGSTHLSQQWLWHQLQHCLLGHRSITPFHHQRGVAPWRRQMCTRGRRSSQRLNAHLCTRTPACPSLQRSQMAPRWSATATMVCLARHAWPAPKEHSATTCESSWWMLPKVLAMSSRARATYRCVWSRFHLACRSFGYASQLNQVRDCLAATGLSRTRRSATIATERWRCDLATVIVRPCPTAWLVR